MILGLQDQVSELKDETHALNDKMQLMMEQLILANRNRFGRSSEQMTDIHQIRFMEVDGEIVFFNEAEAVCDLDAPEPESLEKRPSRGTKRTGKKDQDMSGIPTNRIDHYMTDEQLTAEFGENGWKQLDGLKITGCWVHCRRKFDEAQSVIPESAQRGTMSYLIMKQIQAIYREEGKLKDLSSEERLTKRQLIISPLVDALFVYLKQHEHEVPGSGKLREAFTYALNQEQYLRVFLTDGDVPMDNNASERAIRGFCIGKRNWQVIDTINGATSSAIIYSIAETAKANN